METGHGARFFSEDERVLIGDLLRAGQSVRSIAVRLGRSPSTISREVRRNSSEAGNYRPFTVHRAPHGAGPAASAEAGKIGPR